MTAWIPNYPLLQNNSCSVGITSQYVNTQHQKGSSDFGEVVGCNIAVKIVGESSIFTVIYIRIIV